MQSMIWVMRHANAGPATDAKDDDKRPLDKFGIKQAKAAGIALKKLKTPIQCILSSPMARCTETADYVSTQLNLEVETIPELSGPPLDIPAVKNIIKGRGNCLLVGHHPCVSLIVFRFTGAQCCLTKGGMAQIHEGEVWSVLNASTCMAMADMVDFSDPQEVDSRSSNDQVISKADLAIPSSSWAL